MSNRTAKFIGIFSLLGVALFVVDTYGPDYANVAPQSRPAFLCFADLVLMYAAAVAAHLVDYQERLTRCRTIIAHLDPARVLAESVALIGELVSTSTRQIHESIVGLASEATKINNEVQQSRSGLIWRTNRAIEGLALALLCRKMLSDPAHAEMDKVSIVPELQELMQVGRLIASVHDKLSDQPPGKLKPQTYTDFHEVVEDFQYTVHDVMNSPESRKMMDLVLQLDYLAHKLGYELPEYDLPFVKDARFCRMIKVGRQISKFETLYAELTDNKQDRSFRDQDTRNLLTGLQDLRLETIWTMAKPYHEAEALAMIDNCETTISTKLPFIEQRLLSDGLANEELLRSLKQSEQMRASATSPLLAPPQLSTTPGEASAPPRTYTQLLNPSQLDTTLGETSTTRGAYTQLLDPSQLDTTLGETSTPPSTYTQLLDPSQLDTPSQALDNQDNVESSHLPQEPNNTDAVNGAAHTATVNAGACFD